MQRSCSFHESSKVSEQTYVKCVKVRIMSRGSADSAFYSGLFLTKCVKVKKD